MSRIPPYMWASAAALVLVVVTFSYVVATHPGPLLERQPHPGRELANQYCASCHLPPEPDHLTRDAWPFVLDWMGNYLGYPNREGRIANLLDRDRIPHAPIISQQDLESIYEYFLSEAPREPRSRAGQPSLQAELPLFEVLDRDMLPVENAIVSTVHIDDQFNRLFVGDGNENMVVEYDAAGNRIGDFQFDTQPIRVAVDGDTLYVTLIGDLMIDRHNGQVVRLEPGEEGRKSTHLVENYPRTAHALLHDLNGNGRKDLVVSGFGDYGRGRLAWFENLGDDQYEEHVLWNRDGALKTAVHDFSGNGRPDIMTLIAQEHQKLLLYLNPGEGVFDEIQIVQKHAGFGFNSFELVDFNGNGMMDVLLVNGNNMEIPDPPLRDDHGLRILLNQGDLEFEEAYFYPMYGAIGARAADFTGNGLVDIAAIAFYPDWSAEPPETFVFLEQTAPMEFAAATHPAAQGGRWMSIDAGDLNGDGTPDLVLGAGAFLLGIPETYQTSFLERMNEIPPVLVLKNVGQVSR